MATQFSITGSEPNRTLSIFFLSDGDTYTLPESHPRFSDLLDTVISGADDEEIRDLVDVIKGAARKLSQLSERVSLAGDVLLFDGDPIHGVVVDAVRELARTGSDESRLKAVVNFLEKVKTNPSLDSIDALYRWIDNGDLHLDEDGDFIAYKYVYTRPDGSFASHYSGIAYVDGEQHVGRIPNHIGAVVTMPRSEVDDNTGVACSTGLHAGTYRYVEEYGRGSDWILVKINPRDVVSVPDDCNAQKLRVCRYVVLERHENKNRIESHFAFEPDENEALQDAFNDALGIDDSFYDEDDVESDFEEGNGEEDGEDDFDPSTKFSNVRQQPVLSATRNEDGSLSLTDSILNGAALIIEEAGSLVDGKLVPSKPVRDSKGRFTPESVKRAVRDEKGRFRGFAG